MKKKLNILLFTLCCAGVSIAQTEPPQALFQAINEYLNDGESLKRNLMGNRLDTTINPSEVAVGTPIEVYHFSKDIYNNLTNCDTVRKLLEPTMSWIFALTVRGLYLFEVQFSYKNGTCAWERTGGRRPGWNEIRTAYPETSGIFPIIIIYSTDRYVHFPLVNNYNLTLVTDSCYREMLLKGQRRLSEVNKLPNLNADIKANQKLELDEINDRISITTNNYRYLNNVKKVLQYLKNNRNREIILSNRPRGLK
jgi:hypothetical protein